jgi:isopentenyl diphosphate isomerase/L-lactate dehydrogenase-like FMN-dependent dehydrogenase
VCLGRSVLGGLAVGGAAGVARVLEILSFEFKTAMALAGVTALDQIDATLIWRGRAREDAQ